MKIDKDHKHRPLLEYNGCICGDCKEIIDSLSINEKNKMHLNELETNPLDIYNILKSKDYHYKSTKNTFQQPDLKRKIIIDKLHKLKTHLHLPNKVFHLAVYLFDLIIDNEKEKILKNDQISSACLLLSIKFLQNENEILETKHFEAQCHDIFYSYDDLKKIEIRCIRLLNYNLSVVTPYDYIEYFISRGTMFVNDQDNKTIVGINMHILQTTIFDILFKVVNRLSYTIASSLQIACACICLAREVCRLKLKWNPIFSSVYKIVFQDFEKIYDYIKKLYKTNNKPSNCYSKVIFPSRFSSMDEYKQTNEFFKRKKIRRLSVFINKSIVTQQFTQNLESFQILQEKVKHHSNESNKKTAQSINVTPEHFPITISKRKYKNHKMIYPINLNNITIKKPKHSKSMCLKPKMTEEKTSRYSVTPYKQWTTKNIPHSPFKFSKLNKNTERLNTSFVSKGDKVNRSSIISTVISHKKCFIKKMRNMSVSKHPICQEN